MDRPPLPVEVQQRILRFALPHPSRYTYRQCTKLLKSLSLVSKSWCRLAQPELLAFIVTSKPKRCFFNRLRAGPSPKTPEGLDKKSVRRLLVKKRGPQGTAKAAKELLEMCEKLEEVWLESNKKYQEDDILLLNTVAKLENVHTLHLQRIFFVVHDQHLLRYVRTLSIRAGGMWSWVLLTPKHLPSVTSLNLLLEPLNKKDTEEHLSNSFSTFQSLALQLHSLSITSDEQTPSFVDRLIFLLQSAVTLRFFYLNTVAQSDLDGAMVGLSSLPTLLETLQISYSVGSAASFAFTLKTKGEGLGLASLRKLVVPVTKAWNEEMGWDKLEDVLDESRMTMQGWCEKRGTVLELREGYEAGEDWGAS